MLIGKITMSTRVQTTLVMLGIALIVSYGSWPSLTPAQDKAPARGKWEYKIVKIAASDGPITSGGITRMGRVPGTISEANLNALGEQGWDLFKITGGQPFVT